MALRGIRGAITVNHDQRDEILPATRRLLQEIQAANPTLVVSEIASAFFSVTADICSAFPAEAAREIGWDQVPLMCLQEIPVPGSLPLCIRILVQWNTDLPQPEIHHVYLEKARSLRPEINNHRIDIQK